MTVREWREGASSTALRAMNAARYGCRSIFLSHFRRRGKGES